ncbi:DUF3299 domain-containing protein [Bdellovibrio sp. SKB1291214]|uniref:DUF3299 domain-containing protein n=1 Tax=Bdellovibrio sp. SKB1291214 TaxID=1732569 RepID=UPI0020CBDCA4|nr:DUF3299 domain-containing protein [Bdellovibrio sp. SKB1291214]UYL09705.1 DUF3299 domain-containing protein [Bdellovibrio sp. SKB1291214]
MKKWLFPGILCIAVVVGVAVYQRMADGPDRGGALVDWRLLGEMDYITGKSTAELMALDGKTVRIPGFMVPLEDEQRQVVEFLLVPSSQACIHVPAPPPNQMVYVKMKKGVPAMQGPIWLYGTLKLVTKKSMYGDASFEITGEGVEPYK